jgi:predicted Zn-dependent protease
MSRDNRLSADNTADARKEFEEKLQIDPTNANAAYELGELHRKAGDLSQARAFFEHALSSYPNFEEALIGLGRTLLALDHPDLALPKLLAAAKENPTNQVAFYQLAQAYRALGRAEEQKQALAEFTRLRDLSTQRASSLPEAKRDVTRQELEIKDRR